METLEVLQLVLTQVWQVALIAVIVWTLTRTIVKNQPQLAHLLWALVLLKVITPPIWSSPTSVFSWLGYGSGLQQSALAAMENPKTNRESTASTLTVNLRGIGKQHGKLESDTGGLIEKNLVSSVGDPSRESASDGQNWAIQCFLAVWIVGVCFLIGTTVFRLVNFWRWVRTKAQGSRSITDKNRQHLETQLQAFAQATATKLAIDRKIRVCLIDAPIGPAVVGIYRPAIVLPLEIVKNRSTEFLEPLIAHELIHIRRGDLFWAVLQSLSSSLLWFHPLVWLASRKLTLESERSCDEQTIAWLGCSPKAYANSLIDVLERKHQLRVAPALPGVRPVDVTRKRLERIMRLGQGSRKNTPMWAWAIFFGAVTLVLPGAAFVGAQEISDSSKPRTRPTETLKSSRAEDAPAAPIEFAQFDVGEMLGKLIASGKSEEQARNIILSFVPSSSFYPNFPEHKDGTVSESSNATIDGNYLHFAGTVEQIRKLKQAIEERRQFGFDQVVLKVSFVTMSKESLDQLEIPWRKADMLGEDEFRVEHFHIDGERLTANPLSTTVDIAPPGSAYRILASNVQQDNILAELQVPATLMPAFYTIVTDDKCHEIQQKAQADTRSNVVHAPRVTAFNGARVHINDTYQRPFVTGIVPEKRQASTFSKAVIQLAVGGVKVVAQPIVDRQGNIELLFALNERTIQRVEEFTFDKEVAKGVDGTPIETGNTVQIPQLLSRFLALKTSLKSGDSLIVTNGVHKLETLNDEVLVIIATVNDIVAAHQNKPAGNSSTSAYQQPVRSPSLPTERAKPDSGSHHDKRYERVPVCGPVTSGGPAIAIDPPSDDEIMHALTSVRRRSSNPDFDTIRRKSVRIVKEKIADYVDAPKFVPLIGEAQLHHAHYKCTIYFAERTINGCPVPYKAKDRDAVEVIYIDHNHFHLHSKPTKESKS